ncbi:MAG: cation:proton antiporter, partial [Bacteroidota bacterium]
MAEIAGVVILGILAQWIAWRTRVPAILPLILIGLCIGPIWQYYYGHKLINPVFDSATGEGLFPGQSLFHFVELAIGIILFEGGLTLRRKEIEGVGPAILRLITVGSIVTFVGAGLSAHYLLGLNWNISFLFAGLIIVTGPTVIAPILRNVPLTKNTATVLKWEGILIDPIGALVAVLVYEFILAGLAGETAHFTQDVFIDFGRILVAGLAIGTGFAWALYQGIKKDWIPHYLLNVLTLAAVMSAFVLSNTIAHDSGLFTVVVMGMVLGNLDVPNIKGILDFKESLTVLLISILFI